MRRVVLGISLILSICLSLWVADVANAAQYVIRAGHVNPPGEPAYLAWELLAARLKGKIDVKIYPASQLGGERDLIEQVKMGTLDMTAPSAAPMALYNPTITLFSLPYIFKSDDHLWRVTDGPIGKKIAEETEKKSGLMILDWWTTGTRHLILRNKAVHTPDDMKGVKIRVMESKAFIELFKALGALPAPMPYGEVYQALATGVIDAADNDSSGYRSMRFYEVGPYYSLTAHTTVPKPVLINPAFFKRLPKDLQQALMEALAEATKFQRNGYATAFDNDVEFVKSKGAKVNTVNREPFVKLMTPVWKQFDAEVGRDLIDQVQALAR
jgi:TRAP-type transport system periplasmic protein